MKLFKQESAFQRGEFLDKWFRRRTIKNNKNVILVFTGSTGSGKTYNSLSAGEDWYKFQFNSLFPIENVCFSLGSLMKRIVELRDTKKLKKGTLFILEEAGANFGSLDFQNKISKMFSYILQSFRSMNLILLMTVPVLTMINKQARQLIHANFITAGIDYDNNIGRVKPLFHQLNQQTGKDYWKYPRVVVDGRMIKIERLEFPLPSESLLVAYERKKDTFVYDLSAEFIIEFNKQERDKMIKDARGELTGRRKRIYDMHMQGLFQREIAEKEGIAQTTVHGILKTIRKLGYSLDRMENP